MDPLLIPIIAILMLVVGILCLPFCIWIVTSAQRKKHEEIQRTLRAMIENGQTLSPELLEKLSEGPESKREKDWRWGIILVALGFATAIYGFFTEVMGSVGGGDVWLYIGLASIWWVIGLARLGMWKYAPRADNDKQH